MRVAFVDVDSKKPNLALMKLSHYHKAKGDKVGWYNPIQPDETPDIIYASKVFSFTPDYQYFPAGGAIPIIKGGTGYDLTTKLPPEIECLCPDYDLYRNEYAMGFTHRG